MEEISQRVQAATTMDEGSKEIASAFTTLNVTIKAHHARQKQQTVRGDPKSKRLRRSPGR
jgi:hypothetical protein